jgi:hypothetical protein
MTISSPPLPDLAALCREQLGSEIASARRIGHGRNSRIFRVELAAPGSGPASLVVKFYRRDPRDARDRLATEFGGLQFLWQNGVRAIPQAIAVDRERHCAIYEYLDGIVPDPSTVTTADVEASVRFLSELRSLRRQAATAALAPASEACFSLEAIVNSVAARLERLRTGTGDGDDDVLLQRWLAETFEPLCRDVFAWCRAAAAASGVPYDGELTMEQRTLSPSDFGFHNAIRRPSGSLAFVDFEYFGWDDPAKTLVDFVLHPGMMLRAEMARTYVDRFLAAFADVEQLAARARLVYPLFGLKWCTIVLNDFLPERQVMTAGGDAYDTRLTQFAKAGALAARIADGYRDNPWFA